MTKEDQRAKLVKVLKEADKIWEEASNAQTEAFDAWYKERNKLAKFDKDN